MYYSYLRRHSKNNIYIWNAKSTRDMRTFLRYMLTLHNINLNSNLPIYLEMSFRSTFISIKESSHFSEKKGFDKVIFIALTIFAGIQHLNYCGFKSAQESEKSEKSLNLFFLQ